MNKVIVFLLFICLFTFDSFAQKMRGFGVLGANFSQVDGDRIFGFNKLGVATGVGVLIPISNTWSVHVETLYSQKGSFQRGYLEPPITNQYKLKLDYAEIPVYINFFDKIGKMNVGTGISWGSLVGLKESMHDKPIDYNNSYITKPDKTDLSWIINFYMPLRKELKINLRYAYSINSIRKREFLVGEFREQYNNVITIRLMYIFNEDTKK